MSFLKEFFAYLKIRKKFWLIPIMAVAIILGFLITITQGSAIAPFIYTLF